MAHAVFYSGSYIVNMVALTAARIHVARFWNEKEQTRVPFVQKFNEAVKGSEKESGILGMLAWSWAIAAVNLVFGFKGLIGGVLGVVVYTLTLSR